MYRRIIVWWVISMVLMTFQVAFAQLVPFELPWNDASGGVTNISGWKSAPAGSNGFVVARDGHFYTGNNRIRFLGVNFTFATTVPSHADAEGMAAHLAKFGVNCVRFHHMDYHWDSSGILSPDGLTLNPTQLEKLDYLIYQLKLRGIYANLNMHVSRTYPGMTTWDGMPSFFKGVDLFYQPMIDMQKDYAYDLLTHVNPYTGLSYANDPCVALIEINNENGLMREWESGALDEMPSEYSDALTEKWNSWLTTKYSSSANLKKAWNPVIIEQPLGAEILTNGDFSQGTTSWSTQIVAPAAATYSVLPTGGPNNSPAYHVAINQVDGTSWHVQLYQGSFNIKGGDVYTLAFWAKADTSREVVVNVKQNHTPWNDLWNSHVTLSTDWQYYKFFLYPSLDDTAARVTIGEFAKEIGATFDIAQVSLKPGRDESYGAEMLTNGGFTQGLTPWTTQIIAPAAATYSVLPTAGPTGNPAYHIQVTQVDSTIWHVQMYQAGLNVTAGQTYTLTFWGRADTARDILVNLQESLSPYQELWSQKVSLTTDWKPYRVVLKPSVTEGAIRVTFSELGKAVGATYEFTQISLKPGGTYYDESLGSVTIVNHAAASATCPSKLSDWQSFLWDTEEGYFTDMADYIKTTIAAHAPIIGTSAGYYSPSYVQSKLDAIDCHAYWQHPVFPPGQAWGSVWTVGNVPMAGGQTPGTFSSLAMARVANKPFTVTEYSHCAPNTYSSEGMLLAAAYGALQDWDGIFAFEYGIRSDHRGMINNFFDVSQHPLKMPTFPIVAAMFLRGDVSTPTTSEVVSASRQMLLGQSIKGGIASAMSNRFGLSYQSIFQHPVGIQFSDTAAPSSPGSTTYTMPVTSDTNQLVWNTGVVTINTPKTKGVIGVTTQG
ncbi:MAG TPA: carbohydrate binding domain-containing protein, partial [Armatimonadota bacterium]|nr:carbohydrate binding domain-containing protein [Armatimonadota bacterium]